MKRRKIIEYLKHPELLQDLSIKELQQWIEDFPYSANLRTLLAQKIKMEGKEDKYPEIFHDAAIYSPDRAKLFDTIEQPQKGIGALGFEDADEDEPFTEDELKLDQVIPAQDHTAIHTPDETHLAELDKLNVLGAAAIAGGTAAVLSSSDDDIILADSESEDEEQEATTGEVNTVSQGVEEVQDVQSIGDEQIDEITDELGVQPEEPMHNDEPMGEQADEISDDIIDESLEVDSHEEIINETPVSDYEHAVEESFETDPKSVIEQSQHVKENTSEEHKEVETKKQSGLSDYSRWLIELETRSIVDEIDEDDEGEDPEIISESLARILYSQGHNNQAIDMYQKLMLKYPEKSTYFAAQIEKIKAS